MKMSRPNTTGTMCCSFLGQELAVSAAMGGGRSYILSTIHELYQERSPMAIMGPDGSCVQHHPERGVNNFEILRHAQIKVLMFFFGYG